MDIKELSERALEIREKFREFELKNGKEWGNQQIMEGFVGDVGDLMKLVMAKEGFRKVDDLDNKLEHELADCLWSIMVLSEKYGVDLEESFFKTMKEIEDKIS